MAKVRKRAQRKPPVNLLPHTNDPECGACKSLKALFQIFLEHCHRVYGPKAKNGFVFTEFLEFLAIGVRKSVV